MQIQQQNLNLPKSVKKIKNEESSAGPIGEKIIYPTNLAPRGQKSDKFRGKNGQFVVKDPYRFLENPESSKTKTWVDA